MNEAIELTENATALYRLYDAKGVLLYVGVTGNLTTRFAQHADMQPWWPQVKKRTVLWCDDRVAALAAEAEAIKAEKPVHNVVHAPARPRRNTPRRKFRYQPTTLRVSEVNGRRPEHPVRFKIDPNVRMYGHHTFARFEDMDPRSAMYARASYPVCPVAIGDYIEAYEPKSAIVGDARVVDVDPERRLIYLAVDWRSFSRS